MRDMFTSSLHDIYIDIYILNTIGFSGEYIDRMTALERNGYKKYKEIEISEARNKDNEDTLLDMGIDSDSLL